MEGVHTPEREIPIHALKERAKAHYIDLPYHNWQHALDTYDEAMRIAELCRANAVSVDIEVLSASTLFHDAGLHLKPEEHGFDSHEDVACHIAAQELQALGMFPDKIGRVQEVIASTAPDTELGSIEAKILFQADLSNIASLNPADFLKKLILLQHETRVLTGKLPDIQVFAKSSYSLLQKYLTKDCSLGAFDKEENGVSWFSGRALENIQLLISPHLKRILNDIIRKSRPGR